MNTSNNNYSNNLIKVHSEFKKSLNEYINLGLNANNSQYKAVEARKDVYFKEMKYLNCLDGMLRELSKIKKVNIENFSVDGLVYQYTLTKGVDIIFNESFHIIENIEMASKMLNVLENCN